MDEKPELVIFSQNKIGGVQNYFYNLIKFDKEDFFKKKWLFSDHVHDKDARLPQRYSICEEYIFQYGHEHLYKSTNKIKKLISDKPGLVLINHTIELITIHKHRPKNKTIVYFCHDELYIDNALRYNFLIDIFITHNIQFHKELKRLLPNNREKDIYYLPYGIELTRKQDFEENRSGILKIIFIARLHKKKGVYDLLKIHQQLTNQDVRFQLTIIGNGPEKERLIKESYEHANIAFFSPTTTAEVLKIASENHIYVLPSYLDGIPVALLEAMSVGLVPIIYKFNDGITEVVQNGINGYIVSSGDFKVMSSIIKKLDDDRDLLTLISKRARQKVEIDYNAELCFKNYYNLFKQFETLKKPFRKKHIKYDGILDYPFIPQIFRNALRKLKNVIR